MGGNRTPGTQGVGVGGVPGIDAGTLTRTRSCNPTVTNGNRFVLQERSRAVAPGTTPKHRDEVAQIFFTTNSARLDGNDRSVLDQMCGVVAGASTRGGYGAALLVVGNADHRGSVGHNIGLAARRALAVRRHIRTRLPGAVIWARTLGEARAEQPDLCANVSQQAMVEDRRVDVIYARYKIIVGDDIDVIVVIPKIDEVIDDAKRIVSAKKDKHPEECKRALCYLSKLKARQTVENDSYWTYGDWRDCWHIAYRYGAFSARGVAEAGKELRKRRKSARRFLRENVMFKRNDDEKFRQLMLLDKMIFNSVQKVADRLDSSGTEKVFPYWIVVRNDIAKMIGNPKTLYSCIEGRARSFWNKYIPV